MLSQLTIYKDLIERIREAGAKHRKLSLFIKLCRWEFRNIEEGYSSSESCLKQLLVYETDVKVVYFILELN